MTANTYSLEDELSILIDQIEKSKARIRVEYDDLKEDYLRGDYRKHGLTKRDCERRLEKRTGEVLGHEMALAFLYTRLTEVGDTHNGPE